MSRYGETGTINLISEKGGEEHGYDQADRAGGRDLVQYGQHCFGRQGGRAEDQHGHAGKIFAAAARLGYQPNMAARSLRGGSGANELVVAMFWAQDFRASMMLRFWDGLRAEIEKTARPVRLVIYPYVNDHLKESEALTSGANCHAAIICNASYADLQFLEDTQLPIPVVLYNRVCNGYCSVNVDDLKMGALAARAFADQGCKTAAVLTSSPVFEGMENRMHGFRLEGEQHGLTILANRYCDNSIRGGYEAVSHRLRHEWKQQLPDAVFCGSSAIAHGALRAFCEAGYIGEKLPRLIAVGNGPEEMDAFSIPSLSVVYLPMEDMARECIQLVLGQLDGRIATAESRLLPIEYVPRESCGPLTEDAVQ